MFLAYMDESGNTGARVDPAQPIHMLGCMLVEESAVRPFEDAVSAIAEKHFGKLAADARFEFHGNELFGGRGVFRGIAPTVRIAAMSDLMSAAIEHVTAFGYTGVDKTKSYANDHPHRIAFTLMVERLEPWLRAREALALIVADENDEVGQSLISDMEWFKQHTTSWGYVRVNILQIIDSLHFVKSHNNRLIQVCDMMTYTMLKKLNLLNKHLPVFRDAAQPRLPWNEWIEANMSQADLASWKIGEIVSQITRFRAKIWPER